VSSERPGSASPLFVDLYELTMGEVYHRQQLTDPAVFEAFFQHLPDRRNYVVACGQERVLDLLQALPPSPQDLDYLRSLNLFSESYLAALGSLRFMGDVFAVPEGTVVFPHEPLVRVIGPLAQAQLLETPLLNLMNFATLAATKAARVVSAAGTSPCSSSVCGGRRGSTGR
jgi:nicotinate phosphoribosyltransferase